MNERKRIKHVIWRRPTRIKRLLSDEDWQDFSTTDKLEQEHSERLLRGIQSKLNPTKQPSHLKKMPKLYWPGIKAVAATFLPLLVSLVFWKLSDREGEHAMQQQGVSIPQAQWKIAENSSKKPIYLLLPDSSKVQLYPKSTLKYVADFSDSHRDVYLDGKAFFEITRDPSKPFDVYGGGIKTTVLGTSFTINTQGKAGQTLIKLHSGKIQLQAIAQHVSFSKILLPGESFAFDHSTAKEIKKIERHHVQVPESFYEKSGNRIQFKNARLDKVLKLLSEEYSVQIDVAAGADVLSISYTGEIDLAEENIDQLLQKICLLNGLLLQGNRTDGFTMNK